MFTNKKEKVNVSMKFGHGFKKNNNNKEKKKKKKRST